MAGCDGARLTVPTLSPMTGRLTHEVEHLMMTFRNLGVQVSRRDRDRYPHACHAGSMDAKVIPLHPEDDEETDELNGDEEWLGTEQE